MSELNYIERYNIKRPEHVYFFGTCIIDLIYPQAGLDSITLLERLGIKVHFPTNQSCCGQPAYTSGYLQEAKQVARAQLDLFEEDWPIIIPSGSCAGMFLHHYVKLFADEPENLAKAKLIQKNIYELTEFLIYICKIKLTDQGKKSKIGLHTSCTARREMNTDLPAGQLLSMLNNVERLSPEHEKECCGFGGTFAVKMPAISGAMVTDKVNEYHELGVDKIISADCGCLLNIAGNIDKRNLNLPCQHIASFLLERIDGDNQ